MERLFIYGTLAPGRPNEHILKDIEGSWEEGIVKGNLEEKGWGSEMGYPGIYLDEKGEEVKGFIFSSKELHKMWDKLDSFEGEEYKRTLTAVNLLDGESLDAYIYALK